MMAAKSDAITLLKGDHKKMKKLLSDVESTSDRAVKTREELFAEIRSELVAHEMIEEEIFYPALREHPKAKDIVLEGYEEHHAVDLLVDELAEVPFDDETWMPKFAVIKENIEHHIEEEEGEMFPKARDVFEEDELVALGEAMDELKEQTLAST